MYILLEILVILLCCLLFIIPIILTRISLSNSTFIDKIVEETNIDQLKYNIEIDIKNQKDLEKRSKEFFNQVSQVSQVFTESEEEGIK